MKTVQKEVSYPSFNDISKKGILTSKAFQGLSFANKEYISGRMILKTFKKGEYIWQKLDPSEFCILIHRGLIEIINVTSEGNDQVIGVFGPGEIVGMSAILRKTQYLATALVASKACTVAKIFIRNAEGELKDNQKVNLFQWQKDKMILHEQVLREKINILSAGRLNVRLVEFFQHMINRFAASPNSQSKTRVIPFPMTKTQIAKIVDARVETVIRVLNKWEKLNYVKFDENGIILTNFEKLVGMHKLPDQ